MYFDEHQKILHLFFFISTLCPFIGKRKRTTQFQGRLDGAICEYNESDKMAYLQEVATKGVTNMEMEALVFAALTHLAGIRSAVVCVTLLDRLKGDQVNY